MSQRKTAGTVVFATMFRCQRPLPPLPIAIINYPDPKLVPICFYFEPGHPGPVIKIRQAFYLLDDFESAAAHQVLGGAG